MFYGYINYNFKYYKWPCSIAMLVYQRVPKMDGLQGKLPFEMDDLEIHPF